MYSILSLPPTEAFTVKDDGNEHLFGEKKTLHMHKHPCNAKSYGRSDEW